MKNWFHVQAAVARTHSIRIPALLTVPEMVIVGPYPAATPLTVIVFPANAGFEVFRSIFIWMPDNQYRLSRIGWL